MKKMLKQLVCFSMAVVLLFSSSFSLNANAGYNRPFETAKKLLTVFNYADKKTEQTIKDMMSEITEENTYETVEIGDYISAYNVDTEENFYLYPILCDDTLCYVAHVDRDNNVVITTNTEAFASIDELDNGEEYVIYVDNGIYYATDDDETTTLYKEHFDIFEEGNSFKNMSYDEIYNIITEGVKSLFADFESFTVLDTYDINDDFVLTGWGDWWDWGGNDSGNGQTVTKKCGITNFLLQGNYGLCWACTVGTIANYKTGRNLTGKNVADMMGIGYNDGGTIYDMQNALSRYGLSYSVRTSKPTFAQVKSNIDTDKPFGMCLTASNARHAITGYGYAYNTGNTSSSASTNLVYAWDSNGYQISFKHNSRTISTSGYNFTWYGAVM